MDIMAEIVSEIEKRRAFRAIGEQGVPEDVKQRIARAALLAPSCANKQPWRFVIADEEPALSVVRQSLSGGNYWAKKAPLYLLAVTDPTFDCDLEDRRSYALFDTGMAVMNLQLQAVAEGLVAHPIAGFSDTQLKKGLKIPESHILITIVVVGYPGDDSHLSEKHLVLESSRQERRAVEDLVSKNGWYFDE
jgi:nitroreductase